MVNRVVGPRGGAPLPRGPEPKKPLSKELRKSVADTKAVAGKIEFTRFQLKKEGYTKGPVNGKAARKEQAVAKARMPK